MNLEQLNALLSAGKITKEVFEELSKGLTGSNPLQNDANNQGEKDDKGKKGGITEDEIEKKIQSAIDRATNKLGNENKKLNEELEKMKKDKMTDDERKAYEISQKEKEIQEREAKLRAQENRLYAIKAIKKAGLDDGGDAALELVEFVVAEDEKAIDIRVKAFGTLVQKLVKAEVDKTFKENGGSPNRGGKSASGDNPYKTESFNLTKQMEIELNNPELAKQLKAQAGA